MKKRVELYRKGIIDFSTIKNSFQGWQAYARWGNMHRLREKIKIEIIDILWEKL
ncbi:hypothetical protein J4461_02290 [Candidatus Pacearchaeota archaeon]|nr:hypothetical protein [Candidatus Pacearchaeota archaeon]